jgi:hypothetical protein
MLTAAAYAHHYCVGRSAVETIEAVIHFLADIGARDASSANRLAVARCFLRLASEALKEAGSGKIVVHALPPFVERGAS